MPRQVDLQTDQAEDKYDVMASSKELLDLVDKYETRSQSNFYNI